MGWGSSVVVRLRAPGVGLGGPPDVSCGASGSGGASRWRKRLYLRRRGAHCWWASPMMRMSERGSEETCGAISEGEVEGGPAVWVWREVVAEREDGLTSRGSLTRMREEIQEKGRWNWRLVRAGDCGGPGMRIDVPARLPFRACRICGL